MLEGGVCMDISNNNQRNASQKKNQDEFSNKWCLDLIIFTSDVLLIEI